MTGVPSVLVTGARGFIGRWVVARLKSDGAAPISIDHAWASVDELDHLVGDSHIDRAIHLGWYANPTDYLTAVGPNLRSLQASIELAEVLLDRGCQTMVVAGSCAEYQATGQPLKEDDPIEPWSVYGVTKSALKIMLESSVFSDSLHVTWARLFNLSGPGEHPARLIPAVIRTVRAGSPIDLSPGAQTRDFLDVEDVASALVHLSSADIGGAVNVCSGIGITLRSLLEQIALRTGDPSLLRFGARDYGDHDSMVTVGDPSRLHSTHWAPSLTTSDMIDRSVAFWSATDNRKAAADR